MVCATMFACVYVKILSFFLFLFSLLLPSSPFLTLFIFIFIFIFIICSPPPHPASLDALDSSDQTAISYAVASGHATTLACLLKFTTVTTTSESGTSTTASPFSVVSSVDSFGFSLLHRGVEYLCGVLGCEGGSGGPTTGFGNVCGIAGGGSEGVGAGSQLLQILLNAGVPASSLTPSRSLTPLGMLTYCLSSLSSSGSLPEAGSGLEVEARAALNLLQRMDEATNGRKYDVVRSLIERGNYPVDHVCRSTTARASRSGQHGQTNTPDANTNTTPLISACQDPTPSGASAATYLVENLGANVNFAVSASLSPLSAAVKAGNVEAASLLIRSGADLISSMSGPGGDAGRLLLLSACIAGKLPLVKMILEAGADPAGKVEGVSPLLVASVLGSSGIVKLLLSEGGGGGGGGLMTDGRHSAKGARKAMEDVKGLEAVAVLNKRSLKIYTTVTDHPGPDGGGANFFGNGTTALMLASLNGNTEVMEMLIKEGGASENSKVSGGKESGGREGL